MRGDARVRGLPLPVVDDDVRVVRLIARVPDDELEGDRLARLHRSLRREPARRATAGVVLAAVAARVVEAGALELGVAEAALVRGRRAKAADLRVRRRARLEERVVHVDGVVVRVVRDVEVAGFARERRGREPRDERVVERRADPLGPLAGPEVEIEREALRVVRHLDLQDDRGRVVHVGRRRTAVDGLRITRRRDGAVVARVHRAAALEDAGRTVALVVFGRPTRREHAERRALARLHLAAVLREDRVLVGRARRGVRVVALGVRRRDDELAEADRLREIGRGTREREARVARALRIVDDSVRVVVAVVSGDVEVVRVWVAAARGAVAAEASVEPWTVEARAHAAVAGASVSAAVAETVSGVTGARAERCEQNDERKSGGQPHASTLPLKLFSRSEKVRESG